VSGLWLSAEFAEAQEASIPVVLPVRGIEGPDGWCLTSDAFDWSGKAEGGGKNICTVFTGHDAMAVAVFQAITDGGPKPGSDILVV
jgi:ABC-type sugar transport system substrate-binding protein